MQTGAKLTQSVMWECVRPEYKQCGRCADVGKGRKQATERPSAFSGDLSLDGLRVNQLKLSRNLTGSILLSNEQFQIRAKVTKI